MTRYVFTSANLAYGPKVAALAESLKRHEPDARFVWLVVEKPGVVHQTPPFVDELLDVAGLGDGWLQRLQGRPVVEACTAVKAAALAQLLSRPGATEVVYLDPDIYVFGPLAPVWNALAVASIVLTPHLLAPSATPEGIRDNEVAALKHGVFNLGFVAVKADEQGHDFAKWWDVRLKDYCFDAPELGLFTDQRWIDLVPVFFEATHILRHDGCNVASWNIGERHVVERDGTYWIGDRPLLFWHFSSVDSAAHLVMTARYARNDTPLKISRDYRLTLSRLEAEFGWAGGWSLASPTRRRPIRGRLAQMPLDVMSSPIGPMIRALVPRSVRSRIRSKLLTGSGQRNH